MLSASGTAKHSFFEFGKMHLEKIPLIATPIKASSPFRVADELKFRWFQLEGVAKGFRLQLAGVEQKLMCRDTEQGLGQLPNTGLQEVVG